MIHESCEGWGMNMHELKSVRMMAKTGVSVVRPGKKKFLVSQAF